MENQTNTHRFSAAAVAVFQKYGVRKATMEEIASEAGVSKPTLYATFRNKDAALAGAIALVKDVALRQVETAWQEASELDQILDIFFDQIVLAGFDMLHASPDADAFENAVGAASQKAIADTRAADVAALAHQLKDAPALSEIGVTSAEYADFIVASANNAKRLAQSRAELETYLGTLKTTTLRVLG